MRVNDYALATPAAGDKLFGSNAAGAQKQFAITDFAAPTYKSYIALLTQSGINAPTAIVLENSLDLQPTYSYSSNGEYGIAFNTSIDLNKAYFIMGTNTAYDNTYVKIYSIGEEGASIRSLEGSTSFNGLLDKTVIEIRVYN
jgi:hypothetical protein